MIPIIRFKGWIAERLRLRSATREKIAGAGGGI
jgi:hypothetical protein